jgi:hypothetical protein
MGRKILVALGTEKGVTVLAKTTSKGTRFGLEYGCQAKKRFPCFYLPGNSCVLNRPTWICLDEFYEFNDALLTQRHFSGRVRHLGVLPHEVTEQLLECALVCEDITGAQASIVRFARASL